MNHPQNNIDKKQLFSLLDTKHVKQVSSLPSVTNDEKKKLFSLFDNMQQEHVNEVKNGATKDKNSNILIVDFMNLFLRSWAVNPTTSENGNHIGAIFGSLKSLGYALRILKPTRCIIVADGAGGSLRRRQIYKDYKCKRRTRMRVNRLYTDLSTPDMEDKSIKWQMARLVEYFNILPVTVTSIDNIEADDTISVLCNEVYNAPTQHITIMSADKDFYQLIDDRINVYSPTKKKIYDRAAIVEEYGITAENFIIYRCLDGDQSDNIDGVYGVGLKTVKKGFPFLNENKKYSIEYILKYSNDNRNSKLKLYESVCQSESLIYRNEQLMDLKNPCISEVSKLCISELSRQPIPKMNKLAFVRLYNDDKAFSVFPDYNMWLTQTFQIIDHFAG